MEAGRGQSVDDLPPAYSFVCLQGSVRSAPRSTARVTNAAPAAARGTSAPALHHVCTLPSPVMQGITFSYPTYRSSLAVMVFVRGAGE